MADINIFNIIIDKFHYKKKLYLIILFNVDKRPKIDFYYTILSLGLAIYI